MSECVFCDIVAHTEPASVVWEDDTLMSFMDIGPVNPGHVMVIPKAHVPYLAGLGPETGASLFKATMAAAQAIRNSSLQCEGINLFLADGEAAFQEVFHLHMHIFPRFQGDTFKIDADWDVHPPREELDRIAAQLRSVYNPI